MLATILLASLALVCAQDPKSAPSEEQVSATCAALEKALAKDAKTADAAPALRAALGVVAPRVIDVLDSKGLRHPDLELRGAVVEVLARMDHPDALKALHAMLKRDKKELEEAPPRHAALLRAIARHGEESSIPDLVADLFQSPDRGVVGARILGLGHIRCAKSVDELMRLMRSAPRARVGDHIQEFRLALVVLTGEDKGTDQELWINWYGDHQSKLEIAPDEPELPRELRRRWNQYWGIQDEDEPGREGRRGKGKGK
jgi:HEAT repeat protein